MWGDGTLTVLVVLWFSGAAIAFAAWLVAAMRARSRDFSHIWGPALVTSLIWPLVLIAGAVAWLVGRFGRRAG